MISDFVKPVSPEILGLYEDVEPSQLGKFVVFHQKDEELDLKEFNIAIVGVREARSAWNNSECANAIDQIRNYFYRLTRPNYFLRVIDLGDIFPGEDVQDTYIALSKVVDELISAKVVPIIIGGSHDLTFAQYKGYQQFDQLVNVAVVDERIDIDDNVEEIHARNFLLKLISDKPNYLFNYSHLGYQSYFVDHNTIEILEKLSFDLHRLGEVRNNIEMAEPIIRDADILSFDISAIRYSDAPGNGNGTPHGFYGEEACQIMRYAGMSDKITSVGIYEVNNLIDTAGQTAHLVAQMMWYFMDGYYNRKNDDPMRGGEDYIKYIVHMKEDDQDLIFLKSKKSDRWWMQLSAPAGEYRQFRHIWIPCTQDEYNAACRSELPDRWLKAYQRLF